MSAEIPVLLGQFVNPSFLIPLSSKFWGVIIKVDQLFLSTVILNILVFI